jgi:hypothetical protein
VNADEICLTLPGDDAFHSVAHLVLGGLAVRLDLTFEYLEDLELALDAVLERSTPGEEVTVRVVVAADELRTTVGPLNSVRSELENGGGDGLSLGRILSAVCDGVAIQDRDGAQWIELTKRVERAKGGVA